MKRNLKIILSFFIAAAFFLCGCQKNIDVFVPDAGQLNGPDTTWYGSVSDAMPVTAIRNSLALETFKKDIVIGTNKDTVTTTNGLTCIFPAGNYLSAGNVAVTGKISSEVLLLRKKGDMIRMNRPTLSNNRLLISTAEVFIRLKDTQNITLAPATLLNLRIADPGSIANNIAFFAGEELSNGSFNWAENNDPTNNFINATTTPLQVTTNKLRWTSIANIFDTTGLIRNVLRVSLPSNYTNANTMVYAVFRDLRSVVNLTADISAKKFTSIKLPDGKAVTVIVISHQANDYYSATASITTGASTNVLSVTPVKNSLANINALLDNL